MKKTFIIVALVLAVAGLATATWAGPWGGKFYGRGPMVSNMTPEQQAQVLALQQAHHEKMAPVQEELYKKKMELRGLWLSQNPDQAKINALQQEIFGLIDQMHQESAALRTDILKVVAPQPAK